MLKLDSPTLLMCYENSSLATSISWIYYVVISVILIMSPPPFSPFFENKLLQYSFFYQFPSDWTLTLQVANTLMFQIYLQTNRKMCANKFQDQKL